VYWTQTAKFLYIVNIEGKWFFRLDAPVILEIFPESTHSVSMDFASYMPLPQIRAGSIYLIKITNLIVGRSERRQVRTTRKV
jgi:hypothetical protein